MTGGRSMKAAKDRQALYLTEENSAAAVLGRMNNCSDPRFRQVMTSIITHLQAAVKEIRPTQEEWFEAIKFLTRTGQLCTDTRQEWILLSDVLGVSMLVDAINHQKPSGAPERALGENICLDGKGMPVVVSGRVTSIDGRPVAGAALDVWMTNEDGFYDVQQPGIQPNMNLRGRSEE